MNGVNGRFAKLPDQLTLLRLLLAAPLWLLALLELRVLLGIGLAVAGLTDVLDGFLARRMKRTTPRGSQLDSVADMTLFASMVIWLIMLRPDFFREHGRILMAWAALGLITLIVGWIRFRRFADLHLWSAKAAGFVGYCFVLYMLAFDGPATPFFWFVITVGFISAAESLLVLLTRRTVDEHVVSILKREGRSSGSTE
jgi:phosphatidylglycerophosphate synthase